MWHAILMFGGKNSEIIYPNPGFPIYESVINYTGAKAVPIKLDNETDFNIDVQTLNDLITKKTSLIILNSPSNPTGGLISKKDMDVIVDILDQNPHVNILSDEIYSRIVYQGSQFTSLLSYPNIRERLIIKDTVFPTKSWFTQEIRIYRPFLKEIFQGGPYMDFLCKYVPLYN